jgi:hypothetical protein
VDGGDGGKVEAMMKVAEEYFLWNYLVVSGWCWRPGWCLWYLKYLNDIVCVHKILYKNSLTVNILY